MEALTESAGWYKEQKNWSDHAGVVFNLGDAHFSLAAIEGSNHAKNLEAARAAFEDALIFFTQARRDDWKIGTTTRLKKVLQALIAQGVDVKKHQARLNDLTSSN